jgi:hypothetical protein
MKIKLDETKTEFAEIPEGWEIKRPFGKDDWLEKQTEWKIKYTRRAGKPLSMVFVIADIDEFVISIKSGTGRAFWHKQTRINNLDEAINLIENIENNMPDYFKKSDRYEIIK